MQLSDRIGRRIKLHDLHVLMTVVEAGSMSKAAQQLNTTQPAISRSIAELEQTVGVRLLDRSRQGVEPTIYTQALLARGRIAFDELRQGIKDVEFLADPSGGELGIGYPAVTGSLISHVLEKFSERYPRVMMRVDSLPAAGFGRFPSLQDRTHDLILARMPMPLPDDFPADAVDSEVLFEDAVVIACSLASPWARRRRIDLAELSGEPWVLPPPGSFVHARVAEVFKERGLESPKAQLVTFATELRVTLTASGRYITALPRSLLRHAGGLPTLKMLPIDMPAKPWPVSILSQRNRTLSPVAARFIETAREVTRLLAARK